MCLVFSGNTACCGVGFYASFSVAERKAHSAGKKYILRQLDFAGKNEIDKWLSKFFLIQGLYLRAYLKGVLSRLSYLYSDFLCKPVSCRG